MGLARTFFAGNSARSEAADLRYFPRLAPPARSTEISASPFSSVMVRRDIRKFLFRPIFESDVRPSIQADETQRFRVSVYVRAVREPAGRDFRTARSCNQVVRFAHHHDRLDDRRIAARQIYADTKRFCLR